MKSLSNAAIYPSYKAHFEMAREVGTRIGGIGSRQIKHVNFDELEAKVTISDKTMREKPVRFTDSASYLHIWLDSQPFKNNPEVFQKLVHKKQAKINAEHQKRLLGKDI